MANPNATNGRAQNVAVIGTGVMGRGIAQVAVAGGAHVKLFDSNPKAALQAREQILAMLEKLKDKGKLSAEVFGTASGRIAVSPSLSSLSDCGLVIEAIIEDPAIKRALYAELESHLAPDCVIATNTSSLSVADLAKGLIHPGRFAGFHCFNPVPLMPVVEIVGGAATSQPALTLLREFAGRCGLMAIDCSDAPGFVVNQVGRGYPVESANLLMQKIASQEDIDRILKEQAGFRMGPFELMDLTGLDVTQPVTEYIHAQNNHEPRYRPSALMRERRDKGLLGRKSGEGFYKYVDGKPVVAAETAHPKAMPASVWVDPAGALAPQLQRFVQSTGVHLETKERPSQEALILTAPLGDGLSFLLSERNLDPRRTLAVDALFGFDRRRVFMACNETDARTIKEGFGLFTQGDRPAVCIADSPGFVGQRVIALIINIACDLAERGIAEPEKIDLAVKTALGYPMGPLAWGDSLGRDHILAISRTMQARLGDPRYRPSPWLERRAQLGLSLLTKAL